jgi:hypothetical protein
MTFSVFACAASTFLAPGEAGFPKNNTNFVAAFQAFINNQNFEEGHSSAERVDRPVLKYLTQKFTKRFAPMGSYATLTN